MAPIATAAALAAAAIALLLVGLGRRSAQAGEAGRCATISDAERERLLAILAELSRRFFHVCQDVASIAKTVREKIQASSVAITEEKLREQLSSQCKVFEKLQEIQAEVAGQFNCTPEDIQLMQQRASKDGEVQVYAEGFKTMLSDALGGSLPVLPNVKVPDALNEEKVLAMQAEAQSLEARKVVENIGSSKCSLKKLGEALAIAHKQAWEEVFESHAELVKGCPEVYHSALAIYMRNEDFAKERKKLDDAHQQRMVKLLNPDGKAQQKS